MLRYVTNSRKNNEFTEYPGSLIKFFDLWTWLGARLEQFDPKQIAILILENSGVRVFRSMFSELFSRLDFCMRHDLILKFEVLFEEVYTHGGTQLIRFYHKI